MTILGPFMPGGWQRVQPTDPTPNPNRGAIHMSNPNPITNTNHRLIEAEATNESDDQAVLRVYRNLMKLPTQEARREALSKFSVPMQQAVHALAKKLRSSVTLSNQTPIHVENPTGDPRFGSKDYRTDLAPSTSENVAIAKEWNKRNPDDRVPETNEGGLSVRMWGGPGGIPSAGEMDGVIQYPRADEVYAENAKRFGWDEPLSDEEREWVENFH